MAWSRSTAAASRFRSKKTSSETRATCKHGPAQDRRAMNVAPLPHFLCGDAEGTCILMVHPLGGEGSFWADCAGWFGPGVLGVGCDLPGSGGAPLPDGPLTP